VRRLLEEAQAQLELTPERPTSARAPTVTPPHAGLAFVDICSRPALPLLEDAFGGPDDDKQRLAHRVHKLTAEYGRLQRCYGQVREGLEGVLEVIEAQRIEMAQFQKENLELRTKLLRSMEYTTELKTALQIQMRPSSAHSSTTTDLSQRCLEIAAHYEGHAENALRTLRETVRQQEEEIRALRETIKGLGGV